MRERDERERERERGEREEREREERERERDVSLLRSRDKNPEKWRKVPEMTFSPVNLAKSGKQREQPS